MNNSVRKWLRGRASPCQGEGREFESRLPLHFFINVNCIKNKSGDYSDEVTPVPISNTEVKLFSADDTWWEAAWESRTLPVLWLHGQAVKTPPFHGGNPGSIPGGVTNTN